MENLHNYKLAYTYKCCWNCKNSKDHKFCNRYQVEINPNFTCDSFYNTL